MGTIGIRVLAGGALSGQVARHPTAIPSVAPIASGPDYATDVSRARALEPLVARGHAGSVVEAALRFAITGPALSTVLIGCSDLAQLESLYPHGYQAVKSGEVVVLWGASMAGEEGGGSEKVVAYEKKVPTDGGHVLLENGQVKSMTSVEFAAAPKAGKK